MDYRILPQHPADAPAPAEADDEAGEQPEAAPAPEQPGSDPDPAPADPKQAAPSRASSADWWPPKKPAAPQKKQDEAEESGSSGDDQDDEDPDDDEDDDQDHVEDDEDDEGENDDGGSGGGQGSGRNFGFLPAPVARRRWSMSGSGRKVYSRPSYGHGRTPVASLIEAWAAMRPATRHLLYNGAAFGLGYYLGAPQLVTRETAYLAATYDSWTDPYVCIWYGVIVAIWALDQRTRSWFPLFALLTRIPLISVITGVLLYGTPA